MTRARRNRSPLCLAIVDVDRFKDYNDSHGHLAGDELLRAARCLGLELRGEDTIARFGGEEFVVLLPDCAVEQASAILERLRGATPTDQTVSAGLAVWDFEECREALIGRADAPSTRRRRAGRDRLVEAATASAPALTISRDSSIARSKASSAPRNGARVM